MTKLGWLTLIGFALVGSASGASSTEPDTLPFEYSEGLIWVRVQSPQSARPLNFLLDTGAERSVLNAATAKELGLAAGQPIPVQGVETNTIGRWPVPLAAKAGDLELPERYLALDLSWLASSCARPLDGLLGADVIRGKVVQIDFQARHIRFLKKISPAKADIVLPLKASGDCLCAPVRINNGCKQWLRVDTGCATALQWVTANAHITVDSTRPAIGLAGLAVPQAQVTVSLGHEIFDQVAVGLHRQPMFAGESGLLGNGLLARFKRVTVDTQKARMILTPP